MVDKNNNFYVYFPGKFFEQGLLKKKIENELIDAKV